jgi:hypothetical protein
MRKVTARKPSFKDTTSDDADTTAIPDRWKKPNGIVSENVSLSPDSRLFRHRQRSLNAFGRGFDDIDYAFPGQKKF